MEKIINIKKLAEKIKKLKFEKKTIVHCHGCFDLMHPGHIKHFQSAKKMGDILVITVTPDVYVDKGEGRPVFNENLRAESIAALECVDYVAINKWPAPMETIKLLRPDIYVKGQEYKLNKNKVSELQKDLRALKEVGAKMAFTYEVTFSSSQLLNKLVKKND